MIGPSDPEDGEDPQLALLPPPPQARARRTWADTHVALVQRAVALAAYDAVDLRMRVELVARLLHSEAGMNDSIEDARRLEKYCLGLRDALGLTAEDVVRLAAPSGRGRRR